MKAGNYLYEVWFQDGHVLMNVYADNAREAKKKVNKQIKVRRAKAVLFG